MKFCIVVCIFVVLACHEVFCKSPIDFPAAVKGNCAREELPTSMLDQCVELTCTKSADGKIEATALPCQIAKCKNGKTIGLGPHDLTKKHPDCCLPKTCD